MNIFFQKNKSEFAFTFIEVLVAVVILSIGLLSISGLVTTVIKGNAQSKRMTIAVSLAQAKMEELKNKSYDDSDLSDSNTGNNANLVSTTSVDHSESNIDGEGNSGGIYTRIWNVADDTPSANMKTITVIITWKEMGKERSTSFTTVISE